ncbi:hypothetical protein [Rhizobium laguerreae]|uniref:Uncharacterized protein n=1 Tax=Rhizobium laguerreae TaxID=1076926 RepID=A0A7Y2R3B7_9HYPH|nr:hypothetical protein [Rhizobium laguerreae]NNH63493.1 hypothetical protein [Rhizobium laguerreae]
MMPPENRAHFSASCSRAIPAKLRSGWRPELRENKGIEDFRDSKKNGNALAHRSFRKSESIFGKNDA